MYKRQVLVGSSLLSLLLDDFDHHLEELHDCQNEGAEGQAAEVEAEGHLETAADG